MKTVTFDVSNRVYAYLRRTAKQRGLVGGALARLIVIRELASMKWAEDSAKKKDVDPRGPRLPTLPPSSEAVGFEDIDTEIFDEPSGPDLREDDP